MQKNAVMKRLKLYQATSIITILLTLVGFSYNVYRLEQSEINNNIRTASFEMIKELANLEQIVYASHYEKDDIKGNPRTGWVKVGVIQDLSIVCFGHKAMHTEKLFKTWQTHWKTMKEDRASADVIVKSIDEVRVKIRQTLKSLS